MLLVAIIDGRIGVCGLAETTHGIRTDANTTDAAKWRWYGDDGIAGRGYSGYVTIASIACVGGAAPDQAPRTSSLRGRFRVLT